MDRIISYFSLSLEALFGVCLSRIITWCCSELRLNMSFHVSFALPSFSFHQLLQIIAGGRGKIWYDSQTLEAIGKEGAGGGGEWSSEEGPGQRDLKELSDPKADASRC